MPLTTVPIPDDQIRVAAERPGARAGRVLPAFDRVEPRDVVGLVPRESPFETGMASKRIE